MTNYHMRFPIDLNSMLIWNFFFRFFPIIFVTQNILIIINILRYIIVIRRPVESVFEGLFTA